MQKTDRCKVAALLVAAACSIFANTANADELSSDQLAAAAAAGWQMQTQFAAASGSANGLALNADSTSLSTRGTISSATLWTADGWATSLVVPGPKGDTGATGPQGPQGVPGPAGANGADGSSGSSECAGGAHGCVIGFGTTAKTSALDCGSTYAQFSDGTQVVIYTPSYNCGGGGSSH